MGVNTSVEHSTDKQSEKYGISANNDDIEVYLLDLLQIHLYIYVSLRF